MKITELQLKNALITFNHHPTGADKSMRAAIESLDIEIISDPKTITINGVEVPGPERIAPEVGQRYYAIDLLSTSMLVNPPWANDSIDQRYLERGLLYMNKESCLAAANALLNALKEQP